MSNSRLPFIRRPTTSLPTRQSDRTRSLTRTEAGRFKCPAFMCSATFKLERGLQQHLNTSHFGISRNMSCLNPPGRVEDSTSWYSCFICKLVFRGIRGLQRHVCTGAADWPRDPSRVADDPYSRPEDEKASETEPSHLPRFPSPSIVPSSAILLSPPLPSPRSPPAPSARRTRTTFPCCYVIS